MIHTIVCFLSQQLSSQQEGKEIIRDVFEIIFSIAKKDALFPPPPQKVIEKIQLLKSLNKKFWK